jgi:hypothetical protein
VSRTKGRKEGGKRDLPVEGHFGELVNKIPGREGFAVFARLANDLPHL